MILPRSLAGTMVAAARSEGTDPEPLTIVEVLIRTKRLLEHSVPDIRVVGEVSRWIRSAAGHCYFTLRDGDTPLRGVMYRQDAAQVSTDPGVGNEVIVRGALSVYPARGDLQIRARSLRFVDEQGAWRRRLDALRDQLRAEGLLDSARKRRVPALPGRIGIVTSPKAAALHDILTVLERRYPCCEILLAPTRVQGTGAEVEIAKAVRAIGSHAVDVVIVGRGGGSVEDLGAFNTEPVARAVAASPVPVISAVGHETDVTLCDLVADVRAPTPSAAAELVASDVSTIRARLSALGEDRRAAIERRLAGNRDLVSASQAGVRRAMEGVLRFEGARLETAGPERLLDAVRALVLRCEQELSGTTPERLHTSLCERVRRAEGILAAASTAELRRMAHAALDRGSTELVITGTDALQRALHQRIAVLQGQVDAAGAELEALSPAAALRRGWALLYASSNELVRDPDTVRPGDQIRIVMAGGAILARAEEIRLHIEESHES